MRSGSSAVSRVWLVLLENMVSFAGLPFLSFVWFSCSWEDGVGELCVCVHTCIHFVDFMHIQMASLNKMPLDSNIWYTNVNPCCLQHFRCAFGSVLSPFTMGCLQLQPTEASNSWNQVFTFTLDSLQLF